MEVDPQNLLEEVEAQLRVGGSWMSEGGVHARCRLAKNRAQVVGALIELERQGRALSKDRDTKLALWRAVHADGRPIVTSARAPEGATTTHQFEQVATPAPALLPPEPVAATPEVHVPRTDRATPILAALTAGPLTAQAIAAKSGFDVHAVGQCLSKLKHAGRVKQGTEPRTWELTSGAAVGSGGGGGAARHRLVRVQLSPEERLQPRPSSELRWYLGSDGSVRFVEREHTIELTSEQFDTLQRARQVVRAARPAAEA
jgi:hypothetical protein